MPARPAAAVVALVLCLAACSGDPDSDAGPGASSPESALTEITISCPEFEDTAQKIADAQVELYSGRGDAAAIDALVTELDSLQEGAPDDVREALARMSAGFREAAALLADRTAEDRAAIVELAPELAADGETITEYITAQCA